MTTLEELLKEFQGKRTTFQQEEQMRGLIGTDVLIVGEIRDIDAEHVNLHVAGDYHPPGSLALTLPRHTYLFIAHGGSQAGRLLECSGGDGVRLVARLNNGRFAPNSAHYHFDLVSIVKMNTRDERVARVNEEEAERNCFVATAAFGAGDESVLTLREYRDLALCRSALGRGAVTVYYLLSPRLAKFIAGASWRRSGARALLRPLVSAARRHLAVCGDATASGADSIDFDYCRSRREECGIGDGNA